MFNSPTPVVKNLLIVNIVIFAGAYFMKLNLVDLMGLRYIFADEFMPHQFITYMFMHVDGWHLLGNMFALFVFGPMLERSWGAKKFFTFYMITGVGAGILYSMVHFYEINQIQRAAEAYMSNPDYESFNTFMAEYASEYYNHFYEFIDRFGNQQNSAQRIDESKNVVNQIYQATSNIPMVGASGAIFGILMAFGLLFPNTELMLLFPPIPIKAKYIVGFYGIFEIYSELQRNPGDNVAHWAHLGGMLIAFIMIKIWAQKRDSFY